MFWRGSRLKWFVRYWEAIRANGGLWPQEQTCEEGLRAVVAKANQHQHAAFCTSQHFRWLEAKKFPVLCEEELVLKHLKRWKRFSQSVCPKQFILVAFGSSYLFPTLGLCLSFVSQVWWLLAVFASFGLCSCFIPFLVSFCEHVLLLVMFVYHFGGDAFFESVSWSWCPCASLTFVFHLSLIIPILVTGRVTGSSFSSFCLPHSLLAGFCCLALSGLPWGILTPMCLLP